MTEPSVKRDGRTSVACDCAAAVAPAANDQHEFVDFGTATNAGCKLLFTLHAVEDALAWPIEAIRTGKKIGSNR